MNGKNLCLRRADWEKLERELHLPRPIAPWDNIDGYAKGLTKAITVAMRAAIPTTRGGAAPASFWTEELGRLRTSVRRLRRDYQRAVVERERQVRLEQYRAIKAKYIAKIEEARIRNDPLLIIAADSRRRLEKRANTALSRLERWCEAQKLQISTGKTTYTMLRGSMQRSPLIRLRGRTLRRQVVTKYLGIHMGERGSFAEHITQTCYKATATMQKIARLARNHYHMPMKSIRTYVASVMTSIVTYGASVWAHKAKQVRPRQKLNTAQRGVLITLTGAYRTTSTDALQVIAGILPMDLEVLRVAVEYCLRRGKTERLEELLSARPTTKQQIREHIYDLWQRRWESSTKGRNVYRFLPDIRERLGMEHMDPSRGLTHFLAGHDPFPFYLHERGLRETNLCDCGAISTADHVLLECPLVRDVADEERQALRGHDLGWILRRRDYFHTMDRLVTKIVNHLEGQQRT
ncbi:hypothetical protein Trydic_g15413 [Trypoxylus dichotomus]